MKRQVVLVVDDDAGVKDVARDILELCGHKVLTAATRGDALILCDQWGPEINMVVLDTSLPQPVSSVRVIEKMREASPSAKLILTSIYSDEHNAGEVPGTPVSGFLKKPYRMTELVHMLEKLQDQ